MAHRIVTVVALAVGVRAVRRVGDEPVNSPITDADLLPGDVDKAASNVIATAEGAKLPISETKSIVETPRSLLHNKKRRRRVHKRVAKTRARKDATDPDLEQHYRVKEEVRVSNNFEPDVHPEFGGDGPPDAKGGVWDYTEDVISAATPMQGDPLVVPVG